MAGFYKSPRTMTSKELDQQRKNETDFKQKERLEKEASRRKETKK